MFHHPLLQLVVVDPQRQFILSLLGATGCRPVGVAAFTLFYRLGWLSLANDSQPRLLLSWHAARAVVVV